MRAIILTIRLKYFYLTYKGIKTIEIRKSAPKDFVGDVYEVVSKTNFEKDLMEIPENEREFFKQFVGKVGLKFTLNKVEEIMCGEHYEPECDIGICILPEFTCNEYYTESLGHFELLEKSCLKDLSLSSAYHEDELNLYLKGNKGYAWHIDNLEIFDEPKKLLNFLRVVGIYNGEEYYTSLERAPQSWCYVKV